MGQSVLRSTHEERRFREIEIDPSDVVGFLRRPEDFQGLSQLGLRNGEILTSLVLNE